MIKHISMMASDWCGNTLNNSPSKKACQPAGVWLTAFFIIIIYFSSLPIDIKIRWMLLTAVMIYASGYDLITHRVDQRNYPLIICIGLIGTNYEFFINESLIGLIMIPLPFVIIGSLMGWVLKKQVIGKGDYYFLAAVGFAYGFSYGIQSLIIALSIALIGLPFYRSEKIAFIPIISLGYIVHMWMSIVG